MNTKERILHEALELFSIRGYEAVSMRDISSAVGIRESSLYKHYAGKQGILEAIINMAKEAIDEMYKQLNVPEVEEMNGLERYTQMKIEDIARLCTHMLIKQMENETVAKFRQLLTIEQYKNTEMKTLFIQLFMERPLSYQEKVFDFLLEQRILEGESGRMLAIELFSPFFMLQYKLQEDKETLIKTLETYTIIFIKSHFNISNYNFCIL